MVAPDDSTRRTAPRRQEDLSHRILRIARRTSPPAAIRDDVRAVRGEQGTETPPSLAPAFAHTRYRLPERIGHRLEPGRGRQARDRSILTNRSARVSSTNRRSK